MIEEKAYDISFNDFGHVILIAKSFKEAIELFEKYYKDCEITRIFYLGKGLSKKHERNHNTKKTT